jgi:hypothetical protein
MVYNAGKGIQSIPSLPFIPQMLNSIVSFNI